ncbi:MAG: FecR domain-containing protein [Tannerella sp.]|jgi:ferric-dicitrate binding protein FerR (iron transport regulator)|nr:FecR domain-containing protein [Tannerella sp.]
MNEKEIYSLAILYFEGKIDRKDETLLFKYLSDEANKNTFERWEKEWMMSDKTDLNIAREFAILQNRIQTREALAERTAIRRRPIWRKIASVAAVALLVIGSVAGIYTITDLNRPAEFFTIEVPPGEKSKLMLPDGTAIWLNAGSQISYTNRFNTANRKVELTGEAYFEVAKQSGNPFTVTIRDYEIVVKGTKFNVSSYEDEPCITTTLMEGAVTLICQDKEYSMKPGELMKYDVASKTFRREQVNAQQYLSWTDDRIEYEAITLRELLNRLSRQHGVFIHTAPNVNVDATFNISLNNQETIEELVHAISKIVPLKFSYDKKNIYISNE